MLFICAGLQSTQIQKRFASNYHAHFRHSSIILHSISMGWLYRLRYQSSATRFNQTYIAESERERAGEREIHTRQLWYLAYSVFINRNILKGWEWFNCSSFSFGFSTFLLINFFLNWISFNFFSFLLEWKLCPIKVICVERIVKFR